VPESELALEYLVIFIPNGKVNFNRFYINKKQMIRKKIFQLLVPLIKLYKYIKWKIYLIVNKKIRIIVGAGPSKYKGWFSTDIWTLDITKESDFKKYFSTKKINFLLAEHVFEHLDNLQLEKTIINFYNYSAENINIRIAVPDGNHEDQSYIEYVKPGGTGAGSLDHKHLFTYRSITELFEKYGFKGRAIEYWDEEKIFHQGYKDDEKGVITRSFINDERNKNGKPVYTSLIIDFKKK
jgi:predicted SAM-dependent methyltransferase